MLNSQGYPDHTDAKTPDGGTEAAPALAKTTSSDLDARLSDLTIDDFVNLISNITGQLDLLNSTIDLAAETEGERGYGIIASEIKTLAGPLRQLANGIAAATATASGKICGEAATAITGINGCIQRINELMANAAVADTMSKRSTSGIAASPR